MLDQTDGELIIFKNAFTITLVSWISYLGIDSMLFSLFWLLLFLDYIAWVSVAMKQRKFNKREAIEGIIWKALLIMIPLSLWILWRMSWYHPQNIVSSVFWALAIAEVYSIFWSIYEYRTWKKYKEVDLIALFITKILWLLKVLFDIINSKLNLNDWNKKD